MDVGGKRCRLEPRPKTGHTTPLCALDAGVWTHEGAWQRSYDTPQRPGVRAAENKIKPTKKTTYPISMSRKEATHTTTPSQKATSKHSNTERSQHQQIPNVSKGAPYQHPRLHRTSPDTEGAHHRGTEHISREERRKIQIVVFNYLSTNRGALHKRLSHIINAFNRLTLCSAEFIRKWIWQFGFWF